MIHEQDGIEYRIRNNILKGWRGQSPFKKPEWTGSTIVEGFTQADAEAEAEAIEESTVGQLLDQFETDGNDFYNKVRIRIRVLFKNDRITNGQYKLLRNNLQPALAPLKTGDWDLAQDALNEINRPGGILGVIYDFIKNKVDNYINNAF